MYRYSIALLAALTALLVANQSDAVFLTINNPSFETPDVEPDNAYSEGSIPGWTAVGNPHFGVVQYPASRISPRAIDGDQIAWANEAHTISQVLSSTLAADTRYTLSISVGDLTETNPLGYRLQLFAGSTLLAEDDNSQTPPDGGWILSTVIYDALPSDPLLGQPLKVQFESLSDGPQNVYDNVLLDASPIPEPNTAIIAMVGLGFMAFARCWK